MWVEVSLWVQAIMVFKSLVSLIWSPVRRWIAKSLVALCKGVLPIRYDKDLIWRAHTLQWMASVQQVMMVGEQDSITSNQTLVSIPRVLILLGYRLREMLVSSVSLLISSENLVLMDPQICTIILVLIDLGLTLPQLACVLACALRVYIFGVLPSSKSRMRTRWTQDVLCFLGMLICQCHMKVASQLNPYKRKPVLVWT